MAKLTKTEARRRRHRRVRRKVHGVAEFPRLCVFRSSKHIYAQIIDDDQGITLAAASTLSAELKDAGYGGNVEASKRVGALIASKAVEAGVRQVVFDRGGYAYHGRVKALAETARKNGLEF